MSSNESYGDPETRRRILDVTERLVAEQGSRITLGAVAASAGVSRQALYLHFGDRQGLLLALVSAMDQRRDLDASLAHVGAAASGDQLIERAMRLNAEFWASVAPVARVLRDSDDATLRAAWRDRMTFRHATFRAMVERLQSLGDLDESWTVDRATDTLYAVAHFDAWSELTTHLGWSGDDYVEHMATVLRRSLLTQ